ncbi:hypothetical protein RFI_31748, partial [Reticulomyxa filosa]
KKKKFIIVVCCGKQDLESEMKNWLNTITDADSDGECIRESTVQWLNAIETAKYNRGRNSSDDWTAENMSASIVSICEKEHRFVVDELAEVICGQFFDVFAIRNVVKIIHEIIQLIRSCPSFSASSFSLLIKDPVVLSKRIHHLKRRWCRKISWQLSPTCALEFDRSQQIVRSCHYCLDSIAMTFKLL